MREPCVAGLRCVACAALCLFVCSPSLLGESRVEGRVELLRDTWGIPHVLADTDAGAFYGLGYAMAEDRGFQMTYGLRIVQGRLAEVVGVVNRLGREESSLDHDKKMRTFGFHRAAEQVVENLDEETRAMLQAYCAGVNDGFRDQGDDLHPLFAEYELAIEPWTPADCLASWWHMAQFFATDGTRDLIAMRNRGRDRTALLLQARGGGRVPIGRGELDPEDLPRPLPPDDGPAIVKREDLSDEWIERVQQFAREHPGSARPGDGEAGPKFSHAWVVGGTRTSTGSSVLASDPQTPVRNPSLFYEFHLQGETFNVRGIGVPGSPMLLIGFSEHVAWGVTALGADQADLFLLKTDPAHPDAYFFDDVWQEMDVRHEEIRVRGEPSRDYLVRQTHLGPVATAFCFARDGEQVALKRIPTAELDRETIEAALGMWRARDAEAFLAALPDWRFPSCNMVFGDREGKIGYQTLAAVPIRSEHALEAGRCAHQGTASRYDWQGIVPYDLLPHVLNPGRGYLSSGNHRAIESWYPISFGIVTGGGGDTVRSWRLRELLEARDRYTPEDVLEVHHDSVNPARRDIVRLGLHLRDTLKRELSQDAMQALEVLDDWYRAGASSDLANPGAELATEINTFFRMVATDLAFAYGGGESGLAYFLKTATARLDADPSAPLDAREQDFIDTALAGAWQQANRKYGRDTAAWNARAREQITQRRLGYAESLDGFPSLAADLDLQVPALTDVDGGTIKSQAAQSYTQWVPMHDPDLALSVLPIGTSERPADSSRTSTMELWSTGQLHPAPLSRAAVLRIAQDRRVLREE